MSFSCGLLFSCSSVPVVAADIASSLNVARVKCGYDLTGLTEHIYGVDAELVERSGIRQTYTLKFIHQGRPVQETLELNCSSVGPSIQSLSAPVLSPVDLIIEEDSGGRYTRHVAWHKEIAATNWMARVAFIDYVLGDGQRIVTQEFVICDSKSPIPCLKLSVAKKGILDEKGLNAALSIIDKISLVQPGYLGE